MDGTILVVCATVVERCETLRDADESSDGGAVVVPASFAPALCREGIRLCEVEAAGGGAACRAALEAIDMARLLRLVELSCWLGAHRVLDECASAVPALLSKACGTIEINRWA